MKCECGANSGVIDSRYCRQSNRIRRRRECENGHRFTTFEQAGEDLPSKKDLKNLNPEVKNLLNAIIQVFGRTA
jgi:transcriptional regulator NrdR family protein